MNNLNIIINSLPTLLLYMVVFGLTIACTFGAEWQLKYAASYTPKRIKNKALLRAAQPNRALLVAFTALAVLIPSLLAGVRAETVGTDVLGYATSTLDTALRADSFPEMIQTFREADRALENGYMMLVWLCSRISSSIQVLLFFSEVLVVGFFYAAFYAYRKHLSMWMAMSVFLCISYCTTYNLMRQYIAIAIVVYASSFLVRKKYIAYIALVGLAALFHISALLMFGLLVLWLLFGADIKYWKYVAVAALVTVVLVFWQDIINALIATDLFPAYYTKYIDGAVTFRTALIWRHGFYLAIELLAFKKTQQKTGVYAFFFLIALLVSVGCHFSSVHSSADRLVEYLAVFRMITLAMVVEAEERPLWKLGYIAYIYVRLAVFFGKHFCLTGAHGSFPYVPFWAA